MEDVRPLMEGYSAYRSETYPAKAQLLSDLAAHGQSPHSLVVSCCDSRVDPTTIFNAGPGEIFVVRNVANLVPPCDLDGEFHSASAALAFGVTGLGVQHIVVLGHSSCGGIKALREDAYGGESSGPFIAKWMSVMAETRDKTLSEAGGADPAILQRRLEHASVVASLENLRTFSFIRERVEAGTLSLHGAYYDIASGGLHAYRPDTGGFSPVETAQ